MSHTYVKRFAHFLCCKQFALVGENLRIPLEVKENVRDMFIKMRALKYRHIHCTRPLVSALRAHFRTERIATTSYDENDWCVLVGSDKLVTPGGKAHLFLNVTPYFVQRNSLQVLDQHLVELGATPFRNRFYHYRNCILFLDEYSIPYPGGRYFADSNNAGSTWYRLCYLGKEEGIEREVRDRLHLNVLHKYRTTQTSISPFLTLVTDQAVPKSESYRGTSMVKQNHCQADPAFLLQDILHTYGQWDGVGLIVEAPITISYDFEKTEGGSKRFHYFAVNCAVPNRCLVVWSPYDRLYEYTQVPADIAWATVLYEPSPAPEGASTVVWNGTEIGYVIQDTFFCLSFAKLRNLVQKKWMNAKGVLRKLSFDVHNDYNFTVLNKTIFDDRHVLYTVRYRAIPFDLWCLSAETPMKDMSFKHDHIPSLVSSWTHLLLSVQDYGFHSCALDLQKLLYVMVKHGMCFRMIQVQEDEEERFEFDGKVVEFHVCRDVLQYTNSQRLAPKEEAKEEEGEGCTLM